MNWKIFDNPIFSGSRKRKEQPFYGAALFGRRKNNESVLFVYNVDALIKKILPSDPLTTLRFSGLSQPYKYRIIFDFVLTLLMAIIGVIADTHIPDRARALSPRIATEFYKAGVEMILHAGDVSSPEVLKKLQKIAPIYAVRGNRDLLLLRKLPFQLDFEINEVKIALTHGHGRMHKYFLDKIYYSIYGYNHEHLIPWLLEMYPQADVIVFGHGHIPLNRRINGQLLFNPGSANVPQKGYLPSIGLLYIPRDGPATGEIIELD